jgi:hypothetical protein
LKILDESGELVDENGIRSSSSSACKTFQDVELREHAENEFMNYGQTLNESWLKSKKIQFESLTTFGFKTKSVATKEVSKFNLNDFGVQEQFEF